MHLLILSDAGGAKILPALEFLDHNVAVVELSANALRVSRAIDVIIVDATSDLAGALGACRAAAVEMERPILVVVDDSGLAALKGSWGFDDWILPHARPAELETRLRLLIERSRSTGSPRRARIGDLSIDEDTYVVRLRGRPLDLTYREFELLKYLANNPSRVFTRGQLLQAVWGYDYYGGTRTVDVHIRRLRAKLGGEYENLIGTVRGVGYKLDPDGPERGGSGPG